MQISAPCRFSRLARTLLMLLLLLLCAVVQYVALPRSAVHEPGGKLHQPADPHCRFVLRLRALHGKVEFPTATQLGNQALHFQARICSFNPFTPESDQCQISPAASPETLHHTLRRTWLFIAYSDER